MRKRHLRTTVLLIALVAVFSAVVFTQGRQSGLPTGRTTDQKSAVEKTWKLLNEVRSKSYPEISEKDIRVETFSSDADFFKARFSFTRYLTLRHLKTIIFVNPAVYDGDISQNALRAILTHELAHALYYQTRNRLRLLGLVKLTTNDFTAEFERRADLIAISRGYGEGLIEYREWLYRNIPKKKLEMKRRNYFTPEEITILIAALKRNPSMLGKLSKSVPRDLEETVGAAGYLESR